MATQVEIAEHLDLSQQAVSQLLASGVLPHARRAELDIHVCRIAYVRHLREIAAGRVSEAASAEGLDLVEQRARLAKSQADAQEMKNHTTRGALIPRPAMVSVLTASFANCRSRLLAIPTRAAPLLIGMTSLSGIRDKLTELVSEACAELAADSAGIEIEPEGEGE